MSDKPDIDAIKARLAEATAWRVARGAAEAAAEAAAWAAAEATAWRVARGAAWAAAWATAWRAARGAAWAAAWDAERAWQTERLFWYLEGEGQ